MNAQQDRLTRNQVGAMEAIDMHGSLQAGWGGYSLATMRSLARRNLASEDVGGNRFRLTRHGSEVLSRINAEAEANR